MSKFFLTDPDNLSDDNPRPTKPKGSASIRYKEAVAIELQRLGVPRETSEIAVIDFRILYLPFMHDKESPHLAATAMLPRVQQVYKTDGKWHYN
jgi:hypothetical protein